MARGGPACRSTRMEDAASGDDKCLRVFARGDYRRAQGIHLRADGPARGRARCLRAVTAPRSFSSSTRTRTILEILAVGVPVPQVVEIEATS